MAASSSESNSPATTTTGPQKKDTRIDALLDYIRDHRMPPALEMAVSWLVALSCLLYYGCSYALLSFARRRRVPLVTHVQQQQNPNDNNDDRKSLLEQLEEKIQQERQLHDNASRSRSDNLIAAIRKNLSLRQLVSRFMTTGTGAAADYPQLYHELDAIWLDLLRLPDDEEQQQQRVDDSKQIFDLSLIIPAYREAGADVAATLQLAVDRCDHPKSIQVVVVDAGQCTGLRHALETVMGWGRLDVTTYEGNGGRGPCLNHGAAAARGKYLTFLHSDTLLPTHWDSRIKTTLAGNADSDKHKKKTHACAFAFGHDTSARGLGVLAYPWGIGAVWVLGNLRASCFRLPYGDHVISIPASYFRYLGGYPNQPIMEDYALMDLLRQRAAVLPERLRIIPGSGAQCSVRRWQTFGTVYVTLVNATLVFRYTQCGWTANDVHDYYYQRPFRSKKQL